MHLYLIRHPRPSIAPGICYGRSDIAVAPEEQAIALTTLLPQLSAIVSTPELLQSPSHPLLYASPLQRCAGLAHALATRLDCEPVRFDERLMEMDFGNWELRAWDDIPRAEIDAWAADTVHYRPGGADSVLQMAQRVYEFFKMLRQQSQPAAIVICHGGTIRLLQACAQGLTLEDIAQHAARSGHAIGYGTLITIEINQIQKQDTN
jgi:alpha-ribazole phosphatase